MQKRLKIILELASKGFDRGVKSAGNAFKGLIRGIGDGVRNAVVSLAILAQGFVFVTEAISRLIGMAKGLWNMFVGGAQTLAKLEARFIALTGNVENANKVLDFAKDRALKTGKGFEETASALGLVAASAKDADGEFSMENLKVLNTQLEQLSTLAPAVPIENLARGYNEWIQTGDPTSLQMLLDMPLKATKAYQGLGDIISQETEIVSRGVTSIETGAKGATSSVQDRIEATTAMIKELAPGIEEGMAALEDVSGLERLAAAGQDMANAFGGPVFEAVNEVASMLADLYEQDPELFREVAKSLGEAVGGMIKELAKFDPDKLSKGLGKLSEQIQAGDWGAVGETIAGIAESFQTLADSLERITGLLEKVKQFEGMAGMGQTPESIEALAAAGDYELRPGEAGGVAALNKLAEEATAPGPGAGYQKAGAALGEILQKVVIEIDLKNDMLDAQIRQGADNAVSDFSNAVVEELEGG